LSNILYITSFKIMIYFLGKRPAESAEAPKPKKLKKSKGYYFDSLND